MKLNLETILEAVSMDVAKHVGKQLKVDFKKFDIHEFAKGINIEKEHTRTVMGLEDGKDFDMSVVAGRIALDHLKEIPDYYSRLEKMENETD